MDLKNMDKRIKSDGSCGGFRRCKDRECDDSKEDCKECLEDAYEAMRESYKWID